MIVVDQNDRRILKENSSKENHVFFFFIFENELRLDTIWKFLEDRRIIFSEENDDRETIEQNRLDFDATLEEKIRSNGFSTSRKTKKMSRKEKQTDLLSIANRLWLKSFAGDQHDSIRKPNETVRDVRRSTSLWNEKKKKQMRNPTNFFIKTNRWATIEE